MNDLNRVLVEGMITIIPSVLVAIFAGIGIGLAFLAVIEIGSRFIDYLYERKVTSI